jgi:hypothetical protein
LQFLENVLVRAFSTRESNGVQLLFIVGCIFYQPLVKNEKGAPWDECCFGKLIFFALKWFLAAQMRQFAC